MPSKSSRGPRPSPQSRPEIDPDPISPAKTFPDQPEPMSDDGLEGAKKSASSPTESSLDADDSSPGEDTSVESGNDDSDPETPPQTDRAE